MSFLIEKGCGAELCRGTKYWFLTPCQPVKLPYGDVQMLTRGKKETVGEGRRV